MDFQEFLKNVVIKDKVTGKEIPLSETDTERMLKMYQQIIDNSSFKTILKRRS